MSEMNPDRGEPADELCEIYEIGGREILATEDSVAVHVYDTAYSRYDHLRINAKGEFHILYFPEERRELFKWIGRIAPVVSAKPEDIVREEYWENTPLDDTLEDEDAAEREKVMQAKADREIAATDIDTAFASLLG